MTVVYFFFAERLSYQLVRHPPSFKLAADNWKSYVSGKTDLVQLTDYL